MLLPLFKAQRASDLQQVVRPLHQVTEQHYPLYERYICTRHADGDMYPPDRDQFEKFLLESCAQTVFLEYWLGEQLVATFPTSRLAPATLSQIARLHQVVGEFAREIGVSQAFLANIVRGVNRPSDKVLAALGYKRVEGYVPIDGDAHAGSRRDAGEGQREVLPAAGRIVTQGGAAAAALPGAIADEAPVADIEEADIVVAQPALGHQITLAGVGAGDHQLQA